MANRVHESAAPPDVPALVDSSWVLEHLEDSGVRFVEVDERPDRGHYRHGHIPGAASWSWHGDLQDPIRRDIVGPQALAALLGRTGVAPATHVVLYGDPGNWFAAYAFWLLRLHEWSRVSLIDGGREHWKRRGLPLTRDAAVVEPTLVRLPEPNSGNRAHYREVHDHVRSHAADAVLVDVRTPAEFAGEVIAPQGMSESAQRGGHIPGAVSVPWDHALNANGTFRNREELSALYRAVGVTPDRDVVTYCRIGERSSHTWFVLRELLGYPRVRNYDGSWTEWGSMIGTPVEREDG